MRMPREGRPMWFRQGNHKKLRTLKRNQVSIHRKSQNCSGSLSAASGVNSRDEIAECQPVPFQGRVHASVLFRVLDFTTRWYRENTCDRHRVFTLASTSKSRQSILSVLGLIHAVANVSTVGFYPIAPRQPMAYGNDSDISYIQQIEVKVA